MVLLKRGDGSDGQQDDRADDLRRRAEERLRASGDAPRAPVTDHEQIVHELQAHQIELEMQNEELLRSQEDLADSRAKYFELYELAPVGYITLDEDGCILDVNMSAARLLVMERADMVGADLSALVASDDQDAFYTFRRRLGQVGAAEACDLRLKRASGNPLWVHMEGSTHSDTATHYTSVRVTFSDIDERVRAQEALRKSEDRLHSLVQNSHDIIYTVDLGGILRFVPPSWSDRLGHAPDEVLGHPLAEFLHDDDRGAWGKALAKAARSRETVTDIEYRIRHADGSWRWHSVNLAPEFDEDGVVVSLVANARDISVVRSQRELLERLAMTDVLTGIGNRRFFFDTAAAEAERARRYEYPLAIVMVDVDGLKALNDEFGHEVGDHALQRVAHSCQELRESDVAGRLGGDEFAILLPHTSRDEAVSIAQRLVGAIAGEGDTSSAELPRVTVSAGIGCLEAGDEGVHSALQRADAGLYRAKSNGGNRVCDNGDRCV